ncbi:ELWxxDGT repeat protein, partial [Emticicia fontis]
MNILFTIKRGFLLLLLSGTVSLIANAQSVGLLKDINTVITNNASNPEFFASTGTLMCFAATTDLGKELWVSDGTSGGTMLLKDINPGTASSNIANLFAYNGIIYFSATDGVNGTELWRTDGTPQGTYLFKDINAGSGNSSPAGFTVVNGILFFSAANAANGQELWKTDGTVGGTVMVKDIRGGAGGAEIGGLTAFNNKLVFTASASDFDSDPYISDGTAGGTFKLANINQSGDTYPGGYYNAGGLLYFSAHNYSNSYEPWVTDGTQAGTRMLKNINLQSAPFVTDADSYPGYFTLFNGNVYFSADDGLSGRELYQTDGTNAGTVLLKDINLTADGSGTEGSDPKNFIVYNNTLYFTATDGTNYGLWKTNGTAGGTVLVKALIYLENLFIFNNTLYFTQYDAVNGTELWKSDGTTNGTVLVKDMNPGTADSNPQNYFVFGGNFYFAAVDAVGKNELWKSDGTNGGTTFVKDINQISGNSNPGLFTNVGSQSFFIANDGTNGAELWKTDGTNAGTTMVKDIRSGSSGTTVSGTVTVNNTWVGALNNGSSGLWKSDGTESGTSLLKALNFYYGVFTLFNNQAYFTAKDGANDYELWKTDGTVAGTSLVINLEPTNRSSVPKNLIVSNNSLFFTASGGTNGYEQLYKTDGTAGGTVMVKDFGYGEPSDFADLNGILLFQLYSAQLWKSDGTEIGTELVKEIYPSGFAYPSHLTKAGNYVFLSANDGVNGTELWRTDGTAAGTIMLKNINTTTATASSSPDKLIDINGTLYFVATDGVNGRELWKSDGTANGTVMIKDCNNTSTDSNVDNLINFNGTLYFTATNASGAKRLWKTDGTSVGTVEVNGPSEVVEMLPTNISVFGNKLIFSGQDAEAGVEPFIFNPSGIPNPLVTDQPDNLTICSTGSASFTIAADNATTYQWQVKIGIAAFTDLSESGVYSGVNTATLNISNVSGLNGYQYRCVVSNGFININSNAATLVANTPTSPTSVVANNTNLCSGNPVSLSATCSVGTVQWYNQASGGTLVGTGSPLIQSPMASTTYYAACKNGSCEGSRAATSIVNVATSPASPTGVAASDTSICNGSSVTLTATCATGAVKWYAQATGGSLIASSSPRVLSPTSDISYYAACNDGTCESVRVLAGNITVNVQPTTPSAVSFSQTSICEGISITMTTSCATGTITWYNQATGGSIIGTGSPFTHSPSSTTRYYVTCKTDYCESSVYTSSQILVTPVPLPTGVSVNNTAICSGQSVTLTGTCSSGTIRWYTQDTGGSNILTGSPVSHNPTVNTTYYASCRVGSCERERVATNAVTIASAPGNPTGVSVNTTNVCVGESVSLTATCATGTVNWYNQATGGSSIGTGSPLSQNVAASTTFYASCKTTCNESSRIATNRVLVSRTDGGLAAPLSSFSSVVQNNIFFYKTTISQGITVDSMAVIISSSFTGGARVKLGIYSDNSGVPNTLLASSLGNSNTSLPTLPIGTSKFPLVSNVYLNAGSYWIGFVLSSGEQVLYNTLGANAGYYKAQTFSNALPTTMTGLSANANQEFNVYFSGNVDCAIPGVPTNIGAIPNSMCAGNTLTLSATCATGVATWYPVETDGSVLGTGSPLILTPTISTLGSTQPFDYYVSCKNGVNESNRVFVGQVSVTAVTAPGNISSDKPVYCQGESITLTASCAQGTIRWYNQATGGSILSTAYSLTLPAGLQSSATYYATCNVSNCESGRTPELVRVGTPARKYVKYDAVGTNNGTSWQNAYTSLQSAIENSCAGTEIWIARGTYHPSLLPQDSTDNRYKTFQLEAELLIYGGFRGDETLLSERDVAANPTILSGDFNNDDAISGEGNTLSITNNTENAFHVVLIGGPVSGGVIDGLIIKGGNASGSVNSVNGFSGGLIYYAGPNLPEGQYSLTVNNVTFIGNSSTDLGGGMLISGGGTQIKNSRFIKNQSGKGGGVIIAGPVNLSDVIFEGNRALNEGGGVFAVYSADVIINRAYFKNNFAVNLGGGYSHETGVGKIDNSVFSGNSAGYGGAIFITSINNFSITNATIAKNTATNGGGLVYSNSTTINLKNTIIWGNTASVSTNNAGYFAHPIANYPVGTPTLNQTNSLIQGFGSANGNIDANPLFNNENDADGADNQFFTVDDGFNLTACSPAINAGTNTGIETTDILNNIRPFNSGTADIGAFEYSGLPVATNVSISHTSICSPTTISLSASCAVGTVTWYNQATGGSAIGTGSPLSQNVSATTTFYASCKDACGESSRTATQQIVYGSIIAPTITAPNPKVVCAPNTLTLTASGCGGTVNWSTGATGTSLILSSAGTYSLSATCTVGSCTSVASSVITDLIVLDQPAPPTISGPNQKVVCGIIENTTGLDLQASGCAGRVQWSTGATGNRLFITAPGTYAVSANCTVGSCRSAESALVTGMEIIPPVTPPTIIEPDQKVVCWPNTITLVATGCAGTVTWFDGSSGTSITLSSIGTYGIFAGCTERFCASGASNVVTGLEIVSQPSAPTISTPSPKVVCAPNTLTLTASGCGGTVNWSTGATGTSLILSSVGTYSITATCTLGSCTSPSSLAVTGLQIVTQPIAPTITAPNPKVVCAPNTLTLT